ncbi:MAG: uncharacterized protein QG635_353, partial [Bacteroidota bacterium]|nr:uncharacterized protein [Bacteroidota bacterium]
DKRHLLILITPASPSNETAKNSILIDRLDEIINNTQVNHKNIRAEYFGAAAVAVGNAKQLKQDITISLGIAFSVLFLLVSFYFRDIKIYFLIFTPSVFGGLMALAALYLTRDVVSAITLGVGSALLGITLDYSLYIFNHFRLKGSVEVTLRDVSMPIIMGCLTTVGAFFSLFILKSDAMRDLGLFAGLSVLFACFYSLVILPQFLRRSMFEKAMSYKSSPVQKFIDSIAGYDYDKKKGIIPAILIITAVCLYFAPGVGFNADLSEMNFMSDKLRIAEQNLNNVTSISRKSIYLVSSGKTLEEALRSSEQILPDLENLKKSGDILNFTSVSNLIMSKQLQNSKIARWNDFWRSRKSKLHSFMLSEAPRFHFKPDAFSEFFILLDKSFIPMDSIAFAKLKLLFLDEFIISGANMNAVLTLIKVVQNKKQLIYNKISGIRNSFLFDRQYLAETIVHALRIDFGLLVNLSLIVNLLILFIFFGRLELGLLAFIPIVISWIWTLGIMFLLGLSFNIFNIIISTFIFGLGVDYCIFIVRGMQQEYQFGINNLRSYKSSILLSAFTIIFGIGALGFAKHPALRSIALLTIIGMLTTVLIAFVTIPVMFRWLTIRKGRKRYPITLYNGFLSVIFYSFFGIGILITGILGILGFILIPVSLKRRKFIFHWLVMIACRSTIYVMFFSKKVIRNNNKANFTNPVMIIANHQSIIDIPLVLSFTPKLIILTVDWVWNSPYFGIIARLADFYPVSAGLDNILPKLRDKIADGYSILIFPEGTRSAAGDIRRFHKGAFYLAENLGLDIIPLVIHGTSYYVKKGELLGKSCVITAEFMDKISVRDNNYGDNYRDRTKNIANLMKRKYNELVLNNSQPALYRDRIIKNYIYRSPILEWYARIKFRFENNYELFNQIIPGNARITDLGCGYGFLDIMLAELSPQRHIIAIDYDDNKILTAKNCFSVGSNLIFISHDILEIPFERSGVFIINDVLHYLTPERQIELISKCLNALEPDGMLIIREADKSESQSHLVTIISEFFSTNFGFNKTKSELSFISKETLLTILNKYNLAIEIHVLAKHSSNLIYVCRKR